MVECPLGIGAGTGAGYGLGYGLVAVLGVVALAGLAIWAISRNTPTPAA